MASDPKRFILVGCVVLLVYALGLVDSPLQAQPYPNRPIQLVIPMGPGTGTDLKGGDAFTGRYATIPNKSILTTSVFNYTKDTPFIWTEVHVSVTYESNLHSAERLILEAAEEVVGDVMRDNREAVREKYEFRDLAAQGIEEPTVRWYLRDSWVELRLIFFCPAYRKGYYESEIVKRILDKVADDPMVTIAYPHVVSVPLSRNAPPATISSQ